MRKLHQAIKRQQAVVMALAAEAEVAHDPLDREDFHATRLWRDHAKALQVLEFLQGLAAYM